MMRTNSRKYWILLTVSLLLLLGGSLIGWWTHTGAGTVDIKNVRWAGTNAFVYNARLYVPKGVDSNNPAPGALVVHGGDAQNEIMANVAIELARRGIVTLSIDQPGAGFSDPPSFSMGMGGPDGFRYLRSLDIVDQNNIGLVGMSMGGDAVGNVVTEFPDGYRSVACLDTKASLGPGQSVETQVRNLLVIWGLYEEHTPFFWEVPFAKDVPDSKILQNQLGVKGHVEPGRLYGSIEDGTAGMLHFTNDTHLTCMDSRDSIGSIVKWFMMTLDGVREISPSKQIWPWKVFGSLVALIGLIMFSLSLGSLLLKTGYFQSLAEPVPEFKGFTGENWWKGVIITTVLTPLTYVLGRNTLGNMLKPNSLWPQSQVNRYLLPFAMVLGVITFIIILVSHSVLKRNKNASLENYGITWNNNTIEWAKVGKSLLLTVSIIIPMYLITLIIYNTFNIDLRINFFAIRPMSGLQFRCFLGYLIPFALFYLLLAVILHGFLRPNRKTNKVTIRREMLINYGIMSLGMIIWMIIQYVSTFSTGAPILGSDTNLTIRAIPLLLNWIIVAITSTYYFHKTGHIYVSGFFTGIYITWYLAAGSMISVIP